MDNVTIVLGSHNKMIKILRTNNICIHPGYANGVTSGKDIALIRLPTEMTFSSNLHLKFLRKSSIHLIQFTLCSFNIILDNIRPVCLPNSTYPDHIGDAVTLSGWQGSPSSSLPGKDSQFKIIFDIYLC